ncbi:MAG: YciI family protein [Desulfovibrionaceae bacterium]
MFIILVSYTAPLEEIDAHLPAHREFLARQYEAGRLLLTGPQNPREGGVILARGGMPLPEVEAMVAEDPFKVAGVASYRIVEFSPNTAAPELAGLKEI